MASVPAVPASCNECVSMRIPVQRFVPSGSERRVLRKNNSIRAELHPLFVTTDHVELYNRYQLFMHRERGWPLIQTTPSSYQDGFLSGAAHLGRQWLYFDRDRLVGVALMDLSPGAISLVYFFYDPDWRTSSPGTYSILNQILYARSEGLDHAYLGYRVEDCPSLNYKSRFRPNEVLTAGRWAPG